MKTKSILHVTTSLGFQGIFFDENEKLMVNAWADEAERKEFGQNLQSILRVNI
ncbi:hypothetical protein RM553_13385 [Zunongwangia sp. F363]|uniref:Uncharacterized protein n=1 Tax=Autumnicola tepida TaxID=3075595 RepID=A0ABU3CBX6_9FLAO|nr:hypothetical protein [Zunongwangia sp. F363]MDT0643826.1 hypothetical protein [Zunongwangia sp. F363]